MEEMVTMELIVTMGMIVAMVILVTTKITVNMEAIVSMDVIRTNNGGDFNHGHGVIATMVMVTMQVMVTGNHGKHDKHLVSNSCYFL